MVGTDFRFGDSNGIPSTGASAAENLCADVEGLAKEARSNFSDWKRETAAIAVPPSLAGAEDCDLIQPLSAPKSYLCMWAFPYRTTAAYGRFETFNRDLRECFGEPAPSSREQRVNHPDFYDLRLYRLDQVEVLVSIKDKSALQKTYLFLRVQRAELD